MLSERLIRKTQTSATTRVWRRSLPQPRTSAPQKTTTAAALNKQAKRRVSLTPLTQLALCISPRAARSLQHPQPARLCSTSFRRRRQSSWIPARQIRACNPRTSNRETQPRAKPAPIKSTTKRPAQFASAFVLLISLFTSCYLLSLFVLLRSSQLHHQVRHHRNIHQQHNNSRPRRMCVDFIHLHRHQRRCRYDCQIFSPAFCQRQSRSLGQKQRRIE